MPYDPDGFWIPEPELAPLNNPSAYVGGTDAPVNYTYDSIVPSGVDLGSLGGIQSTGGGYDWGKLATTILGKAATPAGIASLGTAIAGLAGANKPSVAPGWKGIIDPNAMTASREQIAQPAYVPYSGQPVMGRKHFTDTQFTTKAAEGGLMGFAAGGDTKKPRYLQGATDGMADKIATSIDGEQPAALSHGEFVVPADVVSHLGNGNSEAGSKVLYKMMDRIRHARTGNKEQGKRINPEKFTPGGIAGYAGGGVVAFAGESGSLVGAGQGGASSVPVSSESNLSSWAGPGIANYIQKGTALAQSPYQAYTGPLTAGTSPLQQQAFQAAGNLQTPAAMGQATQLVGDAATRMGALSYNPQAATNAYTAPTGYTAGQTSDVYTGTGAYTPQTATNQFQGPGAYTSGDFKTDTFGTASAQQYMNPYLQASLDPQLAEARRQSEITQMGNASKLAQAGAYGGSRGALMQSEAQRNLGTNLANITGQGYNTAYTNAMQQFNADQARQLQAQQGTEQSRQFGAGQAMTGAQQAAQYGQSAQAQNAQQQQFGAQQALSNAQNAAQYGLAGFSANEQARQAQASQAAQIAAQQAQYGQAAQAQNAQQQQFGAGFGLQGLQGQLSAGTALGGLGAQQNATGLANLNAMLGAGAAQRGIEQEGIGALRGQFEEQRLDPYKQIQFQQSLYQGLPVSTTTASTATSPFQQLKDVLYGAGGVYDKVDTMTGG